MVFWAHNVYLSKGAKKQTVTVCPAHTAVALVTFMVLANTNLNQLLSEK